MARQGGAAGGRSRGESSTGQDAGNGAGGAAASSSGSTSVAAAVAVEVGLYAVSALFSYAVLHFGLRAIDPSRKEKDEAKRKKRQLAHRLGKPKLQTNQYEDAIAGDVVNPEHVDTSLDDIGGLEHVKSSLQESVILPLTKPELFHSHGKLLSPPKGVLLYGPPGTGKTMLAKALAKQSGAVFINVRISTLESKWFGEAQKLVSAVFSLAHKLQPAIIFVDEVDALLGSRGRCDHEATNSMKTEFLSSHDGLLTQPDSAVVVIAATNRPWDVDEAVLRRLPRTFEIGMPDASERERILRSLLKHEDVEPHFNYTKVAEAAQGYSGSDLQDLAKQAAMLPLRDAMQSHGVASTMNGQSQHQQQLLPSKQQLRPISTHDFERTLAEHKPSNDAAMYYQQKSALRGHERAAKTLNERTGGHTDITGEDLRALLSAAMTSASSVAEQNQRSTQQPPEDANSSNSNSNHSSKTNGN